MVTGKTLACLAWASSVMEVRGHHHEVRLAMPINSMYNMSIFGGVPEAQDGDWEDVGVPGAGVVGHGGPGSSP